MSWQEELIKYQIKIGGEISLEILENEARIKWRQVYYNHEVSVQGTELVRFQLDFGNSS